MRSIKFRRLIEIRDGAYPTEDEYRLIESKWVIYAIINTYSKLVYIGSTKYVRDRLYNTRLGDHHCSNTRGAVNKFMSGDFDNCIFHIIEKVITPNKNSLLRCEDKWWDIYNNYSDYQVVGQKGRHTDWTNRDKSKYTDRMKELNSKLWQDPEFVEKRKESGARVFRELAPSINRSEDHRSKCSKTRSKGAWVNDGVNNKFICKILLDDYLSNGFKRGLLKDKSPKTWVTDGVTSHQIKLSELDDYLSKGFKKGRIICKEKVMK